MSTPKLPDCKVVPLTLAELSELNAKTCERAMVMLAEHKDFVTVIFEVFMNHRAAQQKHREEAAAERKRWAEEAKIAQEKKNANIIAERKRISTLTLEQKKTERYKIERPRWSGWTLVGGGLDANEDWDEEHDRLNDLYGKNTYIPKKERPLYSPPPHATASASPSAESNHESDCDDGCEAEASKEANDDDAELPISINK